MTKPVDNTIDLVGTVAFRVTDPSLITVDLAAIDKAAADRRITEAANRPAQDPAELLRGEYEDLERRTGNGKAPTEEACKTYAEQEKAKHGDEIKKLEDEIAYVTSLQASPGATKCLALRTGQKESDRVVNACGCDVHVLRRKVQSLEVALRKAKNASDKSHRVCQGLIRDAAETDKLKPRYFELHKIFSKLDTARRVARGLQGGDLAPEPISQGDGFRSRHIQWEGNTPRQV